MKTRWFVVPSLMILAFGLHFGTIHAAAATPVAGIFAGVGINAVPTNVAATGPTKVGALNQFGPTVFELRNATKAPLTSLLVAVDLGAPTSGVQYACSTLTGQALPACKSAVVGNMVYFLFSGAEIIPDAAFRLGFAPADDGTSWPSNRPVTVTANGQIPAR